MRFGQQVHAIGMPKYVPEQHGRYELATQPANLVVHVVAVLVWFATGIAVAQTPPAVAPQPKLTLAQAIALAERNYPRIRASLEQQVAAQGGVSVARSAYLPRTDILWQTNRATANNVYGLLLPQGVVPSSPVRCSRLTMVEAHGVAQVAHWFRGNRLILGCVGRRSTAHSRGQRQRLPASI